MVIYLSLIAVLLGVLGATAWLGRGRKRVALDGAGLLLALIVLFVWLRYDPALEARLFPFTWYVYIQNYWIFLIASLFFGLCISQLPVRWNQLVVAAAAIGFIGYGAMELSWIGWPEVHGADTGADARGHCRQSTGYTCVPAACVSAARHVGFDITEREMARLCLTSAYGTSLFNVFRGLKLALTSARYRVTMKPLATEDLLVKGRVTVIIWESCSHAICCVGDGKRALVHDPLVDEPRFWSPEILDSRYGGVAVVAERR